MENKTMTPKERKLCNWYDRNRLSIDKLWSNSIIACAYVTGRLEGKINRITTASEALAFRHTIRKLLQDSQYMDGVVLSFDQDLVDNLEKQIAEAREESP